MKGVLCGIKFRDTVKDGIYSVRDDGLLEITLPKEFIDDPFCDYSFAIDVYDELIDVQKDHREKFYEKINEIVNDYKDKFGIPFNVDVKIGGWKKSVSYKLKRYGKEYVGKIKVPVYFQYCHEEEVSIVIAYKMYCLALEYQFTNKKSTNIDVWLDDSNQTDSEGRRIYKITNSFSYEIPSDNVDIFTIQADYNQASSTIRGILKDIYFKYL